MPLLNRLCIAYTTPNGLTDLVNEFSGKKDEIQTNDELSEPVSSVLRTREVDKKDIDLEKIIPFQNSFY